MYRYIIMLVCCNMLAMELTPDIQERRSPREVVVQMNEDPQGFEVNLDDDLNVDDHAHLIKYDYIKDVEGDSYYITHEKRQKHVKKVLLDFRRNQPDLYRCMQNRRSFTRASGGVSIGVPAGQSNIPPSVGVLHQEDAAAVPIDDIIEMAANGLSHAVVRKDFTFLEHKITKEQTQKVVATIVLGIVTVGLGILNGYLGNQTTPSC